MSLRIEIASERCTGHGRCYSLAPDMYDADEGGYGVVLHPDVPEGLRDAATLGVASCPETAITAHEAPDGRERG